MTVTEAISKYITFRRSVGEKFDTEPRIMNLFSKAVGEDRDEKARNRRMRNRLYGGVGLCHEKHG